MIYQNRCTFLQLKVVFSCLGHNCKFVRSSNAREILCLVSKILCVVRYKGGVRLGLKGWGKVSVQRWQRPRTQTSSGHSDSSSARRGKNRNKKTQTNKNKLKWNKWCLRNVRFPQIIKLLGNSSCNFEYNFHGFLQRSSIANWRLRFPLPSIISVDLLENRTLRTRVQKVTVFDLYSWISICFECFRGCLPLTTNSRKFRSGCKW